MVTSSSSSSFSIPFLFFALPCKYGDDLCTIPKCALHTVTDIVDNEYQPIHACVMNVRVYSHERDQRAREEKKSTLNSAYVIINDGYIYLYRFT